MSEFINLMRWIIFAAILGLILLSQSGSVNLRSRQRNLMMFDESPDVPDLLPVIQPVISPIISLPSDHISKYVHTTNKIDSNVTCTACIDVVDLIKAEMKIYNSSITIIEDTIKAVCHTIIIKLERLECLSIANDISNITKWLMDGLYPKDICEKLHFC